MIFNGILEEQGGKGIKIVDLEHSSSRSSSQCQQSRQTSTPSDGVPDISNLVSRIPLHDQLSRLSLFLRRQCILRIQFKQSLVRRHDKRKRIRKNTNRPKCRSNTQITNEICWSRVCRNGMSRGGQDGSSHDIRLGIVSRLFITLKRNVLTVAWLKKSVQILSLSFLLRPLGAIFSVMMGIGPQIERPVFPKSKGDVERRPIARGQAVVGIVAICGEIDMVGIQLGWLLSLAI